MPMFPVFMDIKDKTVIVVGGGKDFIFPALVVRGDLVIGISTSGKVPALSSKEDGRWFIK